MSTVTRDRCCKRDHFTVSSADTTVAREVIEKQLLTVNVLASDWGDFAFFAGRDLILPASMRLQFRNLDIGEGVHTDVTNTQDADSFGFGQPNAREPVGERIAPARRGAGTGGCRR
jgi:hypothetical protein